MHLAPLSQLMPEILLIAGAIWIMVGNAFAPQRAGWWIVALAVVLMSGWALLQPGQPATEIMQGAATPLIQDAFAWHARCLALMLAFFFIVAASRAGVDTLYGEHLGSMLLIFAGLMITAAASNLILLFLGLELVSIPTYVLLFLGRANRRSLEATAKYFLLSILASAVMLYGFSFLYGQSGSTDLHRISTVAHGADAPFGAGGIRTLGMVLVLLGLCFKLGSFPAHFYAPDVYEGTTSLNAALLAIAPKAAALMAIARLYLMAASASDPFFWHLFLLLAILTMTIGNVCALWQTNIRRLLAYSSVAHAGYMLIGLTVALAAWQTTTGIQGAAATFFYLVVYAVAVLGTFAALGFLGSAAADVEHIDELAGIGRSHPLVAGALALLMFSLSGIPPLSGFWGKLGLFSSALQAAGISATGVRSPWFVVLVVAGALNAAVAAAYYLRIVRTIFFRPATHAPAATGGTGAGLVAVAAAILVLIIGLVPGPLLSAAREASTALTRVRDATMITSVSQPSDHEFELEWR